MGIQSVGSFSNCTNIIAVICKHVQWERFSVRYSLIHIARHCPTANTSQKARDLICAISHRQGITHPKTDHNAFSAFRMSDPVTFKKSYLSTYLGYLQNSFNIQKLMTKSCSQIIIFFKKPLNCRAGHIWLIDNNYVMANSDM